MNREDILKRAQQENHGKDYADIARTFRPGHADYTYMQKYGIRDYRGGGRSSARETAMRVAAGAIAKKYLSSKRISIRGYVRQVGPISCSRVVPGDRQLNEFFLCDNAMADQVREYLESNGLMELEIEDINVGASY